MSPLGISAASCGGVGSSAAFESAAACSTIVSAASPCAAWIDWVEPRQFRTVLLLLDRSNFVLSAAAFLTEGGWTAQSEISGLSCSCILQLPSSENTNLWLPLARLRCGLSALSAVARKILLSHFPDRKIWAGSPMYCA